MKTFKPTVCQECPCYVEYESEYDGTMINFGDCGYKKDSEPQQLTTFYSAPKFNPDNDKMPECKVIEIIITEKD